MQQLQLRPHQETFLSDIRDSLQQKSRDENGYQRRVIAQAPTGMGKTVTAVAMQNMAREKQRRSLFLVHGRQLVYQASRMFTKYGIEHGVIMANSYAKTVDAPIQVASIDTLASYVRNGRLHYLPPADLLIVDEAHESVSQKWTSVLDLYQGAVVVGLTATPARTDGTSLTHVYEDLVLGPSVQWLTDNEYLVPADYYSIRVPDLSELKVAMGEYVGSELDEFMRNKSLVGDVVDTWRRYARGRPTIVFAAGVPHSKWVVEQFNDAGVSAFHIDANTPQDVRDAAIAAVEDGTLQVISNYRVFNRGFDCPAISCCIDAAPTRSVVTHLQKYGRVLRTHDGKENCIILDHTGNVLRHGPVTRDYSWDLHGGKEWEANVARERIEELAREMICERCGAVFSSRSSCPACGWQIPVRDAPSEAVEQVRGELRKVTPEYWEELQRQREAELAARVTTEDKRRWYGMLLHVAQERGYKAGWVNMVYHARLGVWPNHSIKKAARPVRPDAEVMNYISHRIRKQRNGR